MEEILTVFGQYAFPIACCIFLFWEKYTDDKNHKEEVDALRQEMATAINNNTLALQKLLDALEK